MPLSVCSRSAFGFHFVSWKDFCDFNVVLCKAIKTVVKTRIFMKTWFMKGNIVWTELLLSYVFVPYVYVHRLACSLFLYKGCSPQGGVSLQWCSHSNVFPIKGIPLLREVFFTWDIGFMFLYFNRDVTLQGCCPMCPNIFLMGMFRLSSLSCPHKAVRGCFLDLILSLECCWCCCCCC